MLSMQGRAGDIDEGTELSLDEAVHILGQNVNRSEAEFYWPIELPKEKALTFVEKVIDGETVGKEFLQPLSPRDILLVEMNQMYYQKRVSLDVLLDMEIQCSALSPLQIAEAINKVRQKSGFPKVCDASDIERWNQDLVYQMGLAFREILTHQPLPAMSEMLYELGRKGKRGLVYYELLTSYEETSQKQRKELEADVAYGLMILLSHPSQGKQLVQEKLEILISLLRALYGRDGWWVYESLFYQCRNRSIDLYTRKGKEAGLWWLEYLFSVFSFDDIGRQQLQQDRKRMQAGHSLTAVPVSEFRQSVLMVPKKIQKIPDLPKARKENVSAMVSFLCVIVVLVIGVLWTIMLFS